MVARATWPVAYAGIIPDAIQRRLLDEWYSPESLGRALAARGFRFFVAESADGVVGFAPYVRRSPVSVELTRIHVLPERQRDGIGTRLLDAGLAELGCEPLQQLTVSVERDNVGRRFYERAGFGEPRELTHSDADLVIVDGSLVTHTDLRAVTVPWSRIRSASGMGACRSGAGPFGDRSTRPSELIWMASAVAIAAVKASAIPARSINSPNTRKNAAKPNSPSYNPRSTRTADAAPDR
jgi:ribosomal protein S18 acetylase RimI-like enzyme